MEKKNYTKYIAKVAVLSAAAFLLMFLEIPLPLFPAFLRIDLSDLPVLVGGFALGPLAAVLIELVKNILHFFIKNDGTGGVGNFANFLVGCALAVPAAWIYIKYRTRKAVIIGMVVGAVSMVAVAALANYFILMPLYLGNYGPAVIAPEVTNNARIVDVKTYVLYAAIPFNAIKAVLVCLITAIIYKRLSTILHK